MKLQWILSTSALVWRSGVALGPNQKTRSVGVFWGEGIFKGIFGYSGLTVNK